MTSSLAGLNISFTWKLAFVFIVYVSLINIAAEADEDYYHVLGINRYAEFRDIRKAYKKLALITHPDKNKSNETLETFLSITKAYEVLKDPESRRKYDLLGIKASGESSSSWRQEYEDYSYFTKTFGYFDDDRLIIVLTEGDFDGHVKYNKGMWFVFFYNPHCDRCYKFKETWRKVASELDGVMHVAVVNCKEDFALCSKLGYIRVPKFVIFMKDMEDVLQMTHDSFKTTQELIEFAMKHTKVPLYPISPVMWQKGMQTQWVFLLCEQSNKYKDVVQRLAIILENIVSVGEVADAEICSRIDSNYRKNPLVFWRNHTISGKPMYSLKTLHWSSSRSLADSVLKELPEPKQLNIQNVLDILKRSEHGSKEVWLVYFYFGSKSDVYLELKRLPAVLPNILIGTIDCSGISNYCQALNIGNYHQWGVISSGGKLQLHFGRQTIEDISAYVHDCIKGLHLKYITSSDYTNVLNSGEPWIIIWTSFWCANCRDLLSSLRRSSDVFRTNNISLGVVECGLRKELCIQNEIRNYPTIKFYSTSNVNNFFGPFNTKSIMEFMYEMMDPKVIYVTEDVYAQRLSLKDSKQMYVILYYSPLSASCYALHTEWRQLAKELSLFENTHVAELDCRRYSNICSKQKINFYPTVHVYPTGSVGLNYFKVFNGEPHIQHLLEWLTPFMESPVQHIFPRDLPELVRSFKSFLVFFYDSHSSNFHSLGKEFFQVAEKRLLATEIHYRLLNCESDINVCREQGIGGFPQLVLYDYGTRHQIMKKNAKEIVEEVNMLLYLPHDEL